LLPYTLTSRLAGRRTQEEKRSEQLDKAGQCQPMIPPRLAIRDKSNLVLGTMLFELAI